VLWLAFFVSLYSGKTRTIHKTVSVDQRQEMSRLTLHISGDDATHLVASCSYDADEAYSDPLSSASG
jgi:hypothetical protein